MSTFQKVANAWTALTDAEKIALFKAADDANPAISDLSALGKFRIATYAEDNTQPKCTVTAVPKDQIVLPKELISIHSFENIDSITITDVSDTNIYIKYAFTADLINYKIYNTATSTWGIIQSDSILTNGMTATQINNLTSAQIMQLFGSASGLGIAMGIPSSKVVSVDNLAMQVDMKGAWNHAVYGTDVTYGYTNNNVLSVKLLTNGDYKINYNNLGTS